MTEVGTPLTRWTYCVLYWLHVRYACVLLACSRDCIHMRSCGTSLSRNEPTLVRGQRHANTYCVIVVSGPYTEEHRRSHSALRKCVRYYRVLNLTCAWRCWAEAQTLGLGADPQLRAETRSCLTIVPFAVRLLLLLYHPPLQPYGQIDITFTRSFRRRNHNNNSVSPYKISLANVCSRSRGFVWAVFTLILSLFAHQPRLVRAHRGRHRGPQGSR